jgi:hypothetical protein
MMWVAGMLAVLGSIRVVSVPLAILFVQIDVLMLIVAALCLAVAFVSLEQTGRNSVLNLALWITGFAALATAVLNFLPILNLSIVLPFVTINGLMLIIGFVCLMIAYVKTWSR